MLKGLKFLLKQVWNYKRKTSYMIDIIEDFSYGKDIRIYGAKNFNSFMTLIRDGISYSYLVYHVLRKMITIGDFSMYINAVAQFSNAMNKLMRSI